MPAFTQLPVVLRSSPGIPAVSMTDIISISGAGWHFVYWNGRSITATVSLTSIRIGCGISALLLEMPELWSWYITGQRCQNSSTWRLRFNTTYIFNDFPPTGNFAFPIRSFLILRQLILMAIHLLYDFYWPLSGLFISVDPAPVIRLSSSLFGRGLMRVTAKPYPLMPCRHFSMDPETGILTGTIHYRRAICGRRAM